MNYKLYVIIGFFKFQDGDLNHGSSGDCDTFDSPSLCSSTRLNIASETINTKNDGNAGNNAKSSVDFQCVDCELYALRPPFL